MIVGIVRRERTLFLVQQCACCRREQEIDATHLQVGVEDDPNVVRLPNCKCGAVEFMNRYCGTGPAEAITDHLRLVNAVVQELIDKGQSTETCEALHEAERKAGVVPIHMFAITNVDELKVDPAKTLAQHEAENAHVT